MQHYWSLDKVQLQRAWLTIGSFDGVHIGHQAIINKLLTGAKEGKRPAVVLTFHPHPAVVLNKRNSAQYLTTPEERADLLGHLGVDVVVTHPFSIELSKMSAKEFVTYLHNHLQFEHLIVGFNFALGRDRGGNIDALRNIGTELGYTVQTIEPIKNGNEIVSSSQVRARLAEGDIQLVNRLLGRPIRMSGKVIPGDGRGRLLGIPTANLDLGIDRALPGSGVYACLAHYQGSRWRAVANVGYRPTFDSGQDEPLLEAHLMDFDADLYGRQLTLEFFSRLREEKRFPNVDALVTQIHFDIEKARKILPAV